MQTEAPARMMRGVCILNNDHSQSVVSSQILSKEKQDSGFSAHDAVQTWNYARVQPGLHLDPVKHCWVGSACPEGCKVLCNTF